LACTQLSSEESGAESLFQKRLEEAEEDMDLSGVTATVCTHFGIDSKKPVSASKRQKGAHACAVPRVGDNPDLIETAGSMLEKLGSLIQQQINIETTCPSFPYH